MITNEEITARLIALETTKASREKQQLTFPLDEVTQKILDGVATASQAFPIGAVFISTTSEDPSTLLGYGVWAAFGSGRVLVGLDAGQTEFDVLGETGGAKTHTLTIAQMPAHHHTEFTNGTNALGGGPAGIGQNTGPINSGLNTGDTGGGGSHNNLQPYIVVQMWKRTS